MLIIQISIIRSLIIQMTDHPNARQNLIMFMKRILMLKLNDVKIYDKLICTLLWCNKLSIFNRNIEKISKKSKESKLILILEAYKTAKKKSGFDSFH